jgi:hypothetical protein
MSVHFDAAALLKEINTNKIVVDEGDLPPGLIYIYTDISSQDYTGSHDITESHDTSHMIPLHRVT